MTARLAMICPTKGRPEAVGRMGKAWEATGAHTQADLWWIVDADDTELAKYKQEIEASPWMKVASIPHWMPMVPKLNWAARQLAEQYEMVGFLGDDHLPRSDQWDLRLAAVLDHLGTGIAYGRDGFQDEKLPTWWVMTSDLIQLLERMVPASVQHMYCDNAVMRLGTEAEILHYEESVLIEHMHPIVGKAMWDAGHIRVNRQEQYLRDRTQFEAWVLTQLPTDVRRVKALIGK